MGSALPIGPTHRGIRGLHLAARKKVASEVGVVHAAAAVTAVQ